MTQPDIAKVQDELTKLLGTDTTAELLMHRALTDGGESSSISLLDMRYQEERNDYMHNVGQTALLLEQDDINLPDFTLRPKLKGIAGKLLEMLGNMSIDFDDSPEFSSAYNVVGWVEPAVRVLFVKSIRDHFAKDNKWSVCGHGKRLVVFQRGKKFKEADHDNFIKEALGILSLFQEGEAALDARMDVRRETRPEDVTASADRMGGFAGAAIARQLDAIKVTRSELEGFVKSGSPRNIPNGMARQVIGQIKPAIGAVIVASLVGIVFGVLCIVLEEGYGRLIAVPCFMTALIGLVGGYYLNRYRTGKRRVLRDGILHAGAITDIERTRTKVNGQRRHLVTIQAGQTNSVCRAYGLAAKQANMMKESGESVRFLVDPTDPTNVLCLDLLTISEG